ncbi:TolB family protein [Pontibacillus salicampi]|uniref:TolB family protein n=1 Tax=Pontibacillus salicampi TaxID=1449801 RepID=A0ABV6LKU2_9BACI
MSLRSKNLLFLFTIIIVTSLVYLTGTLADGPPKENGYGPNPSLSSDGESIAFTYTKEDEMALYKAPSTGGQAELLFKAEKKESFTNPVFLPNASTLLFLKEFQTEDTPYKQLMQFDIDQKQVVPLMEKDEYINDVVISADGQYIFYSKANTYKENNEGKPMPDQFDIYRMDLETKDTKKITDKKALTLSSLSLSEDRKKLLYSTYYNSKDVLYLINLQTNKEQRITPEASYETAAAQGPILGTPTISPNGRTIVFMDVANTKESGTYEYELFSMQNNGDNVQQITRFHSNASSPAFFPNGDELLITVNENFAKGDPEYEYWKISKDGKERQRIILTIP